MMVEAADQEYQDTMRFLKMMAHWNLRQTIRIYLPSH